MENEDEVIYDASNEDDVKKKITTSKQKEQYIQKALSDLMSTKEGRYFSWTFLEKTHIFHSSMDKDALYMAFKEGQRSIGLEIFSQLIKFNELYSLMVKENTK
jgi:hypothetical protein